MSPASESRGFLGQRLLVWAIEAYRRHLSGRGLLRRVTCTFCHTESCSAHGLRLAKTAPSLLSAARAIFGRLRRCHTASLYRRRDSGGYLWGELYDDLRPDRLEVALESELPQTRAAMLWSALSVATIRSEPRALRLQLLTRLRETTPRPPRPEELLVVRSDEALRRRPERQLKAALLVIASLAVVLIPMVLLTIADLWMLWAVVASEVGLALAAILAYLHRRDQLEARFDLSDFLSFNDVSARSSGSASASPSRG